MVILELIHASAPDFTEGSCLLDTKPTFLLVIHNNQANRRFTDDRSFKFLTYQLWSVRYWLTEAMTGNGELGFDSGEGA